MQASILIVSKNRKLDLIKTLKIIDSLIDKSCVEVLVFLDGCIDGSAGLVEELKWVQFFVSEISIGASAARHKIYPYAKAPILIGLDDDAHPLNKNFILQVENLFKQHPNVGILAFEEVKGVFTSDEAALKHAEIGEREFLCSEFIGCGFAIKKSVYDTTNGFPVWIDIYGEESCVAIEVMANGYDILYSSTIKVNHRVDRKERKLRGQNYFRFGKQLKNTTYYYLVYYPNPIFKILKLYWHNFRKYALVDRKCFRLFFTVICDVIVHIPKVLKYRNPVAKVLLLKMRALSAIKY